MWIGKCIFPILLRNRKFAIRSGTPSLTLNSTWNANSQTEKANWEVEHVENFQRICFIVNYVRLLDCFSVELCQECWALLDIQLLLDIVLARIIHNAVSKSESCIIRREGEQFHFQFSGILTKSKKALGRESFRSNDSNRRSPVISGTRKVIEFCSKMSTSRNAQSSTTGASWEGWKVWNCNLQWLYKFVDFEFTFKVNHFVA